MHEYKIVIRVEVPDKVTTAEVEEWARFKVENTASMSLENPLCDRDLDAIRCYVDRRS